jgi:cytochrome c biogenesis protein
MTRPRKSPSDSTPSESIVWQIISFFTSVRTTIGLLFLLAAASVVGTVVPQEVPAEQIRHTASFAYRLILILDLNSVYRSWWFVLLLVFLGANLLGCLFNRLPAIPTEWKADPRRTSFTFSLVDSRSLAEAKSAVIAEVSQIVAASPRVTEAEGTVRMVWVKHRVHLLGFPLIHAAIVVILVGGLIGLLYGVKGHVQIKEGEVASQFRTVPAGVVKALPFSVAVDRFTLTRYPTGEPKEFRSDVRLLKDGKEVRKGSILVNHPMTFEGISLYQSDYRVADVKEVRLKAEDPEGKETDVTLRPDTLVELPGTPLKLALHSLDPGATRKGPGVEIEVKGPEAETRIVGLFKKDLEPAAVGPMKLRFGDYTPLYSTGLQVGYDPGTPLVWGGCLTLVLGFLLTLFTNHRSVFVELQSTDAGTHIRISGRSKRLRREFRESLEQKIRGKLANPDTP